MDQSFPAADALARAEAAQLFKPDRRRFWLLRVGGWAVWPLVAAALALPWSMGEPSANAQAAASLRTVIHTLSVLLACVLAASGIGALAAARRLLDSAVMADDEGVWLARLPRSDGLVPWRSVERLKDRLLLERLELLGAENRVLLSLDCHLEGFPQLRELAARRHRGARGAPAAGGANLAA